MRRGRMHRWLPAIGLVIGAGVAGARPLAAQAPGDTTAAARPAPVQGMPAALLGGIPHYLTGHPQLLHLTPKQVDRVQKLAATQDSVTAPLREQWQQVTGGRPLREIPVRERRGLARQLQPIMRQARVADEAALDSVNAILTPQQQEQLRTLVAEYRERMQARARGARPQP
jgi:hypothetical protein